MKTLTACTLDCPDACSLVVETDNTGVKRISGNPHHPITAGFSCAKMKRFGNRLRSPNRITRPLLKKNGQWKEIGWEEALDICAEKIQRYRSDPAAILHILGGADKGILRMLTDLFFARLGASRVAGCLCDDAGIAACIADFGSLDHNDIRDLIHAHWIVNWGRDPSRSSIHVAALMLKARQRGAQILTISPGGDANTQYSDVMVQIRPGTDRFLSGALIQLLEERGRLRQGILDKTCNWDRFRELIYRHSIDELCTVCGVSKKDMERVFSFYARSDPVATVIGYGVQRHRYGGENVRFINALALLSGHIGQSGGGSYFNISSLRNLSTAWAKGEDHIQRRTFLFPTIGRDILDANDPPIKMIWVNGTNVVNQAPDSLKIAEAFAAADFTVVVDAFMTDTAERANLVLPCKLLLEKEDLVGSYLHNFVHYVRPVVEAPGKAKDDCSILSELGRRLTPPVNLPDTEACLQASITSPFLETTLDELKRAGFTEARRPWIAYKGLAFAHADGRYHFPMSLHPEPPPPTGYPLRLLTLVRKAFLHSQILPEMHDEIPVAWVSNKNNMLKDIDISLDVFIASPLGRLKVKLKTLSGLHPEAVLYRRDDWIKFGGGINQLIEAGLTDMGDCAPFYQQYVRLEN